MLNLQETIYSCLLNSNISSLPVDVFNLKADGFSWMITTKSKAVGEGLLNNDFLRKYAKQHDGLTILMEDKKNVIIYGDELSYVERNSVISHEIAHIILGHSSYNGILGKSSDREIENKQEAEANLGGLILLAPPCVMVDKKIYDYEDIMKQTGLSEKHAIQIVGAIQQYKRTRRTQTEKKLNAKLRYHSPIIFSLAMFIIYLGDKLFDMYEPPWLPEIEQYFNFVYVAPDDGKFHQRNCIYLIDKNNITEMTADAAIRKGYGMCMRCRPLDEQDKGLKYFLKE